MRPTNLPSARSSVVWTLGTPLWIITVNAGACAAARETVTAPSRARNARPGLTSEAVIESQRESQGLPGGHRLRDVHAQPPPIDAQAQVGEPAAERREPIGGQSTGPAADEPRLSRVREDDEVRALEREERLRAFVLGARRARSRGAAETDEQAAERVGAVGRDRRAHGRRYSGLGGHVLRARVLEAGAQEPARGRVESIVAGVEGDGAGERRVVPVVDRRVGAPGLVVAEHGPGIARFDGRLPVMPRVEVEAKRAVGLDEGAARDALAEVVIAIVALEQKRRPPDLAGAQPPIFDRRDVVEGAELDPVGRGLAGPQLGA